MLSTLERNVNDCLYSFVTHKHAFLFSEDQGTVIDESRSVGQDYSYWTITSVNFKYV